MAEVIQRQTDERQTDEALVMKVQAGDKQAEEEILLRYRNLVRFCARKFFLIGGETEDLIQEGMMGLFQAIGAYDSSRENGARFKNFAYLCIWRRIVDAVKSAKNKQPSDMLFFSEDLDRQTAELDLDEAMIFMDDQKEITQKISRVLSDLEFRLFTLYLNGMSLSEICEVTGKSRKSVDNALQRSKNKLMKMLKTTKA